ncbi:hypothetical protein LU298_16045 [Komagataeibacter intermedius]|uniref:Uncharacterized protein n=1 Tax=Komagataeibacter intermedius AF2 TaxID=1458464 RepID=A0A0N1FLU7_9PROT|nr:hypothetical protein [Komagataeibacter intermedius]KPH85362.1 hypothetical protein GLUCOINTEAF2_0201249 [Komagataeibacter intermedius AF2]MCF3637986.1 hypothetical protein [Komagataeibacter intermedius]
MRFFHLLAAASLLVTVQAHAAPTSPEQHGLFDGGSFPPSASGLATQAALSAYAPLSGAEFSGAVTLEKESTVQSGLVFWSRTYNALPVGVATNAVWKCDDCFIGSGSKGILVIWNGTTWTGVSGEAVSH